MFAADFVLSIFEVRIRLTPPGVMDQGEDDTDGYYREEDIPDMPVPETVTKLAIAESPMKALNSVISVVDCELNAEYSDISVRHVAQLRDLVGYQDDLATAIESLTIKKGRSA